MTRPGTPNARAPGAVLGGDASAGHEVLHRPDADPPCARAAHDRRAWRCGGALAVLLAMMVQARAQQAEVPAQGPALDAAPAPHGPDAAVTTLEEVRALPPEDEVLDLYRFDNPVKVAPNAFDKAWNPPPSPKEISENGGYLLYGVSKLVEAATKNLPRVPGVKGQIQAAVARPPPLDAQQMDRAVRIAQDQPPLPQDAAAGQ